MKMQNSQDISLMKWKVPILKSKSNYSFDARGSYRTLIPDLLIFSFQFCHYSIHGFRALSQFVCTASKRPSVVLGLDYCHLNSLRDICLWYKVKDPCNVSYIVLFRPQNTVIEKISL